MSKISLSLSLDAFNIRDILNVALEKKVTLDEYIDKVLFEHIVDLREAESESEPKAESTSRPNMLMVAVARAKERPTGDKFTLQDLFPNVQEWAMVEQPRMFGRHFRGLVETKINPIARHVGVTQQNKAIYERL